jgi:alpha-glucosidase (family GH31 glycosyl hydrolase)
VINRHSIELRYRLLPYFYNAFYQETQTGLPIMRPLFLDDPADEKSMDPTPSGQNNEFLFGDDLLVAPVVTEGEFKRKVYLPKGTWLDFGSDEAYVGPLTMTVDAPLDRIPMFVRAGAIVPTRQVVQYTGEAPIDPLTFEIFPQGNSSGQYYEDDGDSYDYKKGVYLLETVSVHDQDATVSVGISAREGTYKPPSRSVVLKIHGMVAAPRKVQVDRRDLAIVGSPEMLEKSVEGAAYDSKARIVWVKTPDRNSPLEVTVVK